MLVLFLNELSSVKDNLNHIDARKIALDLIKLLRNIRKEQKKTVLNSIAPIKHSLVDSTLSFQELLGGDEFKDEWRFLRGFLNRSPISSNIEALTLQSHHEKEYLWQGEPAIALGWADSIDTATISFASIENWKVPEVSVLLRELDDSADIIESERVVRNFATTENIAHHVDWLRGFDDDLCPSANELWEKRQEYLPNLRFFDRAQDDIQQLSSSNVAYRQMYIKLKQLDSDTKNWISNTDENIRYSTKTTPEGDTRKRLCNLKDIDDEVYCFHMHQRFTGDIPGRIHFRVSTEENKVIVAYIGKKLELPIIQ